MFFDGIHFIYVKTICLGGVYNHRAGELLIVSACQMFCIVIHSEEPFAAIEVREVCARRQLQKYTTLLIVMIAIIQRS